jgi:hypothetical protein
MTRKNRLERKERRSRDTSLEYSTVGGITSKAADLSSGGLRPPILVGTPHYEIRQIRQLIEEQE